MNPRLIRVVTSQFTQLQGLYTAALGLFLLFIHVLNLLPNQDAIDGIVRTVVWLVPFMFYMWANDAIPRSYARRFGRVVRNGPWDRPHHWMGLWLIVSAVLLSTHTLSVLLWTVWLCYPLYLVSAGWPYRPQHLLTAAAAVYAVSNYLPAARSTSGETAFDFSSIAIALVVAGLLDHLVLVRALPSSATRFASTSSQEESPTYDPDAN